MLKGRGEKMRFTKTVTRKLAMLICLALVLTMLPVSEAKADMGVIAVTTSGGRYSFVGRRIDAASGGINGSVLWTDIHGFKIYIQFG